MLFASLHQGAPLPEVLIVIAAPAKRPSISVNVVLAVWHSIGLRLGDVRARVRRVYCNECPRAIRWWERCVRLDGEHFAHLECYRGQLFLKACVAHEIRRSQLIANEDRGSARQPCCTDSTDNESLDPHRVVMLLEPIEPCEDNGEQADARN
jgi:hypothetical protein